MSQDLSKWGLFSHIFSLVTPPEPVWASWSQRSYVGIMLRDPSHGGPELRLLSHPHVIQRWCCPPPPSPPSAAQAP